MASFPRPLVIALLALLLAASHASAGTMSASPPVATYSGDASNEDVSIRRSGANIEAVWNSGVPASGTGCNAPVGPTVTCPGAGITRLVVTGQAGDDDFGFSDLGMPVEADLGPGIDSAFIVDQLVPFTLTVNGGEGDDSIVGGMLGDRLGGGPGDDVFLGGLGADDFAGGDGSDLVRYDEPGRLNGVDVSIDGQANDGDPSMNERDLVGADVERLEGTNFADQLTGSPGNNVLHGLDGEDSLDGGPGLDQFFAGPGSDQVFALDVAAEPVDCGADTDTATLNRADVATGCESQVFDTLAPETTIDQKPKKRTSKRKAKFTFSASEPGATFECALDKKAFRPCTSPFAEKVKPDKRHTFRVRATDFDGNADPSPARARWKVKRR